MARTFALNSDGSITISDTGAQLVDIKGLPVVDAAGAAVLSARAVTIAPWQIVAHARDPKTFLGAPADVQAAIDAAAKAASSPSAAS